MAEPKINIVLQIYHLDDGEEARDVAALIEDTAAEAGWAIEAPTDATNSLLVVDRADFAAMSTMERQEAALNRATTLLCSISEAQVNDIRAYDLGVSLCIECSSGLFRISDALIAQCARLAIDITVFDADRFLERCSFVDNDPTNA